MRTTIAILALFGIVDARHIHLVQKDDEELPETIGWTQAHPDFEGVVGKGRSKLVPDTLEPPTEWSNLPYGPYR